MKNLFFLTFIFLVGLSFSVSSHANCLRKDEILLSKKLQKVNDCIITTPAAITTTTWYYRVQPSREWDSVTVKKYEGSVALDHFWTEEYLIQITNTCTNQVVHSFFEDRTVQRTDHFNISIDYKQEFESHEDFLSYYDWITSELKDATLKQAQDRLNAKFENCLKARENLLKE